MMKIALVSDHAGWQLKKEMKGFLRTRGHEFTDFGTRAGDRSVDYPDYGLPAAEAVASGKCERGIFICGAGIGFSIVANKVPGIRAAACYSVEAARLSRSHNDANVLTMGARLISKDLAEEMAEVWLTTPFDGGRHQRRIEKIAKIEKKYLSGGKG